MISRFWPESETSLPFLSHSRDYARAQGQDPYSGVLASGVDSSKSIKTIPGSAGIGRQGSAVSGRGKDYRGG